MNKKEITILSGLIGIFIAINIVNYIKRENLKKSFITLVEEDAVRISINDANSNELEDLPGIGPVMANRIVKYRKANGGFQRLEDLKKVKGIGPKIFQKILPYIKL